MPLPQVVPKVGKKTKRLIVTLTLEEHRRVKVHAASIGQEMSEFGRRLVLRAVDGKSHNGN